MATSSLQVAQILADLQTLQNADPTAALALLNANNSISPALIRRKSQKAISPELPKFDQQLGRRIHPDPSVTAGNGPAPIASLNRFDSTTSSGSGYGMTSGTDTGSGTGTPLQRSSAYETDEDMKRAKTLLELFEMRGKFKQMGDTGLTRSKARVDQAVAKYAEMELAEKEKKARARYLNA